jgi:hypothetical protein
MERRRFVQLLGGAAGMAARRGGVASLLARDESAGAGAETRLPDGGIVGMYIHEGWPYRHPYAARTWTLEDWRGYADGMKRLGYNMMTIWPALETMPSPLTASDRASIRKTAQVIDMLHREFGMTVYLTLCPNTVCNNPVAAQYSFETRYFYGSSAYLDPGDPVAVGKMIKWREELLRPLAQADGVAIIDSDPGGYPESTNDQFVNLMMEHRRMLNRLRPGIELCYWMHVGWQAYCRYYATGKFAWGTPAEAADVLAKLKQSDPRPWRITIHTMDPPPNGTDLQLAQKMGLAENSLAFNYGAIEGEPSFPMTRFGGDGAFKAGAARAPGGVVGNAQTHCLQLPNTFAFARGAQGRPVAEADYVQFAGNLLTGLGQLIVDAWQTLAGKDSSEMRSMADKLQAPRRKDFVPGPLRGLLFGNPQRFISDLVYQLRMQAAYRDAVAASQDSLDKEKFRAFLSAAKAWQGVHGYQTVWLWPGVADMLRKLKSPAIDRLIDEANYLNTQSASTGNTPFERQQSFFRQWDNYTPRLIVAMDRAVSQLSGN